MKHRILSELKFMVLAKSTEQWHISLFLPVGLIESGMLVVKTASLLMNHGSTFYVSHLLFFIIHRCSKQVGSVLSSPELIRDSYNFNSQSYDLMLVFGIISYFSYFSPNFTYLRKYSWWHCQDLKINTYSHK